MTDRINFASAGATRATHKFDGAFQGTSAALSNISQHNFDMAVAALRDIAKRDHGMSNMQREAYVRARAQTTLDLMGI